MSDWYSVQEPERLSRLTMLIYGPSGAGKTRFASTWPDPVFIDLEGGMASIDHPVGRIPASGPRITTMLEVASAVRSLREGGHPFKTIVVDSLNELQTLCLRYTVDTYSTVKRVYDNQPTLADFGKAFADFEYLVRTLLSLPYNIVFTCHATERVLETDLVKPLLQGKNSAAIVCRLVDMIGYATIVPTDEGNKHSVMFGMPNYVTKDRSGKMTTHLYPPSWDVMMGRIGRTG